MHLSNRATIPLPRSDSVPWPAEAMARLLSFLACLLAICLMMAPQACAQAGVANTITSAGMYNRPSLLWHQPL